jgi:two-component system, NarL family, sensor histidine kinase DevS
VTEESPTHNERLADLRQLQVELEASKAQVTLLTRELEVTNQGLFALHAELEDARQAEARLASIVRSTDDALVLLGSDLEVSAWNSGAEHLFGYADSEIVGRNVEVLLTPGARDALRAAIKHLQTGGHTARYETWWRRRDGSLVEAAVTLSEVLDVSAQVRGYSAVIHDLTEWRRAEEELASVRANEKVFAERDRIARDLHDLVIQRIFASGMSLQATLSMTASPEVEQRISGVVDDLDATIAEIRSAIFALGHAKGAPESVRTQILEVVTKSREVLGFRPGIRFEGPVDAAVPPTIVGHLVAVAREALSNVARHARASRVQITLTAGDEVVLEVTDNGRGIGNVTRRSGLANMVERSESLGGSCTVTSIGKGTTLVWRAPLQERTS